MTDSAPPPATGLWKSLKNLLPRRRGADQCNQPPEFDSPQSSLSDISSLPISRVGFMQRIINRVSLFLGIPTQRALTKDRVTDKSDDWEYKDFSKPSGEADANANYPENSGAVSEK